MAVCFQIRVTFVNEFGVEEAGIDGGGIFKDFMENITRAAFDVQYGLFKVMFKCLITPMLRLFLIHKEKERRESLVCLTFLVYLVVRKICSPTSNSFLA